MSRAHFTRRGFMAASAGVASRLSLAAGAAAAPATIASAKSRPNVLFIAVDDLNDWVEPLGGYDGVITPNLTRLARKTRLFRKAYAPAPACSPARAAVLFGVEPFHSGVYTNYEQWQLGSKLVGQTSLPRYFRENGYLTVGAGKVFHDGWRSSSQRPAANDPGAWSDYDFCDVEGRVCELGKEDREEAVEFTDELSFGETRVKTSEMPDVDSVKWFIRRVLKSRHDRPFFGAIGLRKPHGPFIVPQKFFDLYDDSRLHYPPGVLDPAHNTLATNEDVADLPPAAIAMLKQFGEKDHKRIVGGKTDLWKDIVHSYLATISFSDYCLGLILDAWLGGPNASNTIVVLWSDHGWQLGEKMGWRKFTLWERATRVPLMIGGAFGGTTIRPGAENAPTSTVSLFRTLAHTALSEIPRASELGGLPLDGKSLKSVLLDREPGAGPALSTWMLQTADGDGERRARHVSVRTANNRLIAYGNGDRELYYNRNDPYEFRNLLARPDAEAKATAERLAAFLPAASECAARARTGG